MLAAAAGLLRCPVCRQPLEIVDVGGHCSGGHHFDVARQGYLNLSGAAEPHNADTPDMLAARARVQAGGLFDQVAEAMVELGAEGEVVVEVGAGNAFYLAALVEISAARVGLATDVSKAAARIAAKAHPRIASVVADTWRGLPLRDGVVDVLACVFAPRNVAEFHRVLRPGGRLIVATPGPDHLIEPRTAHRVLDEPADKTERLDGSLADAFAAGAAVHVRDTQERTGALVADLIAMGPNAFHDQPDSPAAGPVTIDVLVRGFRKR